MMINKARQIKQSIVVRILTRNYKLRICDVSVFVDNEKLMQFEEEGKSKKQILKEVLAKLQEKCSLQSSKTTKTLPKF